MRNILLSSLIVILCLGCQSHPAPAARLMYAAFKSPQGALLRRETFTRGESPQLILQGYGGQKVQLELSRNGKLAGRQDYEVPEPRLATRDDGFAYQSRSGMGMERKASLIRYRNQVGLDLGQLPVGFYEVALKINGETKESIRFSVLGDGQ